MIFEPLWAFHLLPSIFHDGVLTSGIQTGINYSSWYIVNLIFNKIIFSRFRAWW